MVVGGWWLVVVVVVVLSGLLAKSGTVGVSKLAREQRLFESSPRLPVNKFSLLLSLTPAQISALIRGGEGEKGKEEEEEEKSKLSPVKGNFSRQTDYR